MGRAAARHSSMTASHTSTANSTSVLLKLSGEYWKLTQCPDCGPHTPAPSAPPHGDGLDPVPA